MLSLVKELINFKSDTHDASPLFAKDLIDEGLFAQLVKLNEKFEDLNEEELRETVLIQSKILIQLGLYEDGEEENPLQLVALVRKVEKPVKRQPKKRFKGETFVPPKAFVVQ